ncbi:hypothetical protein LCGC14_2141520 [marine sediment metagenome]|uniref:Transmembrane protein n=1 Tax=marine sediment metagenome TaxID=412755 RepID=A0A0F9DY82_9ZZZZ
MKSIACTTLKVVVYVLEFMVGVFFIPIALMEMLLLVLYELEFSLRDPSEARGSEER